MIILSTFHIFLSYRSFFDILSSLLLYSYLFLFCLFTVFISLIFLSAIFIIFGNLKFYRTKYIFLLFLCVLSFIDFLSSFLSRTFKCFWSILACLILSFIRIWFKSWCFLFSILLVRFVEIAKFLNWIELDIKLSIFSTCIWRCQVYSILSMVEPSFTVNSLPFLSTGKSVGGLNSAVGAFVQKTSISKY